MPKSVMLTDFEAMQLGALLIYGVDQARTHGCGIYLTIEDDNQVLISGHFTGHEKMTPRKAHRLVKGGVL